MKRKILDLTKLDADRIQQDLKEEAKQKDNMQRGKWKNGAIIQTKDIVNMNVDDTWNFFMHKGLIDNNRLVPVDYSKINGMLTGKPIAVIGSGFSGRDLDWNLLDNITTIGINHIVDHYKKLNMLIFQDHRFTRRSNTDLTKFKGKIFVANSNPIIGKMKSKKIIPFVTLHTRRSILTLQLENGLYARKSTGLCAVHLALCLGADPIYMIGLDTPKNWKEIYKADEDFTNKGIHILKDYRGGVETQKALIGYLPVLNMYKTFIPFKHRIINVCKNGIMDWFNQISIDDFNKILEQRSRK